VTIFTWNNIEAKRSDSVPISCGGGVAFT